MPREHMSPERLAVCSARAHFERQRGPDMSGVSPISELLAEVALLRDERDAATGQHRLQFESADGRVYCYCGGVFGSLDSWKWHVLEAVGGVAVQQEGT